MFLLVILSTLAAIDAAAVIEGAKSGNESGNSKVAENFNQKNATNDPGKGKERKGGDGGPQPQGPQSQRPQPQRPHPQGGGQQPAQPFGGDDDKGENKRKKGGKKGKGKKQPIMDDELPIGGPRNLKGQEGTRGQDAKDMKVVKLDEDQYGIVMTKNGKEKMIGIVDTKGDRRGRGRHGRHGRRHHRYG